MATLKQCNRCGATRDFSDCDQAAGWSQLQRQVVEVDLPTPLRSPGTFQVRVAGYTDLCPGCDEAFRHWLGTQLTGKPK